MSRFKSTALNRLRDQRGIGHAAHLSFQCVLNRMVEIFRDSLLTNHVTRLKFVENQSRD